MIFILCTEMNADIDDQRKCLFFPTIMWFVLNLNVELLVGDYYKSYIWKISGFYQRLTNYPKNVQPQLQVNAVRRENITLTRA